MKLSEYSIKQRKIDASKGTIRIYKDNQYKACGVDRNNKRFTIHSSSVQHITGINLYDGNRYVKYADNDKWLKFDSISN